LVRRGFSAIPNFVTNLRTSWLTGSILAGQNEANIGFDFHQVEHGALMDCRLNVLSVAPGRSIHNEP